MNVFAGAARPLSRRRLLAAGVGLSLSSLAGRASAVQRPAVASPSTASGTPVASPAAGSGLQPDGTWTFTDDRGVTVTLPELPRRVIADVNVAAALWDFGVRPVGVFGWNITADKTFNAAGGNVDPNAVEFLNDPGTTLDVERAAAARPDLILSLVYGEQYGVWSIDPDVQSRIEEIAPIVTISGIVRADRSLERFAELARALGVDLGTPEIAVQQASYEAAKERFSALAAEKNGLSAIFVWASPAEIYVASPSSAGDVMLFRDLGLDVPTLPVAEGEYWELLSTEQALKYPSDLLFYSLRSELAGLDAFQAHPTFAQHPAVLAEQVFSWNQDFILNYAGIAASLTAVADAIAAADPGIAA